MQKQAIMKDCLFLYSKRENYLIISNPPIIGNFFISPLAPLIIPMMAKTKRTMQPIGKIINQPIIGIIDPTILTITAEIKSTNC